MIFHLKKPFDDKTKSSSYRKWTIQKVKTGARVRSKTTVHVLGDSQTTVMFCDFDTWEAAYTWLRECFHEDLANGWDI